MDDAESKRRMAEAKASGEHNFYMMEMAPGLIIDARTKCALAPPCVHAVLACACLGVTLWCSSHCGAKQYVKSV